MPPSTRHSTPVIKKTLDPVFPAETSTFDFPIYLSLAGVVGGRGLEGVLWDKVNSFLLMILESTKVIAGPNEERVYGRNGNSSRQMVP